MLFVLFCAILLPLAACDDDDGMTGPPDDGDNGGGPTIEVVATIPSAVLMGRIHRTVYLQLGVGQRELDLDARGHVDHRPARDEDAVERRQLAEFQHDRRWS